MKDSNKRAAPPRLQRLAREARQLAMECVEGTAPEFGRYVLFVPGERRVPCCAWGHLAARSDTGWPYNPKDEDMRIVAQANDDPGSSAEQHARLVFPLLALADALEDASKTPKENP